jgi:alpha-mannosidase
MHKNVLGLTLLRSPIYGDLRIREIDDSLDYDIIDRGIVEGRLRFSMGVGESDFADSFQNPPTVIDECNHGGILPPTLSYFGMEQTGATLMTLKHAEDDSSTVLRLSEDEGCAKTVTLRLRDKEFEVTLSPYEIKTLKESADGLIEVDILERNINE